MVKLIIIHASTREGRKGIGISNWIAGEAKNEEGFETEFVDLRELNLPFHDEPHHPRTRNYTKQHTRDWSAKIDAADAFIIVTTEYNHGIPSTLKNAIDYLHTEWTYKPVALVGYAGISGGVRGLQQLKQVLATPKMLVFEGMQIPFFDKQIQEDGTFEPNPSNERALEGIFKELLHLGEGMKALREPVLAEAK